MKNVFLKVAVQFFVRVRWSILVSLRLFGKKMTSFRQSENNMH